MLGLEERTSLGWLGLLRLAVGALFLDAAWEKLAGGFDASKLKDQLAAWQAAGRTFAFYRDQLEATVMPHLALFARLSEAGEIVAGLSLLLGFGSRAGALVGLFLNVNYFFASRQAINLLAALVNVAVLVGAGGRALGLDGVVKTRRPGWFLG